MRLPGSATVTVPTITPPSTATSTTASSIRAPALTVTPALCFYLLSRAQAIRDEGDSRLVAWLKRGYARLLTPALRRPGTVITVSVVMLPLAVRAIPFMGRAFLPPFNEGTLTINLVLNPGTSLGESNRVGAQAELLVRQVPEVIQAGRRTGRAELDEHAEGVQLVEKGAVERVRLVARAGARAAVQVR